MTQGEDLTKRLARKKKLVWDEIKERGPIFELAEGYKEFLNQAKTERLAAQAIVDLARKAGFMPFEELAAQKSLGPGGKFYTVNRGKAVLIGILGQEGLEGGFNLVGSHLDSPRLDFKPNPLYEEENLALFKTHYYGGIKKYQWMALPLAIHGVVIKADGTTLTLAIGEAEDDPVFTITDLLPHLAKEQMQKKAAEFIEGEALNILAASIPYADEEAKERVKLAVLNYLHQEYALVEEDLISAELEVVPAGKARDVGLDKSLIGGYGQDDRVSAYTSLKAILETQVPSRTALALFVDKEEIGSTGNTGMQGSFLNYVTGRLIDLAAKGTDRVTVYNSSRVLSADVDAALDPTYAGVMDKHNAVRLGGGVALNKYTGSGGKYDANDASAEFLGQIRRLFNERGIIWQIGELGKVDQGGGGTIAQYVANGGMDVLDCGVPVLSMHSPFEISSKADVYEAYRAYKVFLEW